MTVRTPEEIKQDVAAAVANGEILLPDNSSGEISPADIRGADVGYSGVMNNIADSFKPIASQPITTVLVSSSSTAIQEPPSDDISLQVSFGAGDTSDDVTIAANGDITFLTAGSYDVTFRLTYGRVNNSGTAFIITRATVENIQVGLTYMYSFERSGSILTEEYSNFVTVQDNQVLRVEIARDSVGANDGGIYPFDPVVTGWATVPSASVSVSRITV